MTVLIDSPDYQILAKSTQRLNTLCDVHQWYLFCPVGHGFSGRWCNRGYCRYAHGCIKRSALTPVILTDQVAVYCIGVLYNEIASISIFGILVRIIIVDRPEGSDNYALGGCRCQPFTGSYAYSLA